GPWRRTGPEGRRARIADHWRQLREASANAAIHVSGGPRPAVEEFEYVANGRRVELAQAIEDGRLGRGGRRHDRLRGDDNSLSLRGLLHALVTDLQPLDPFVALGDHRAEMECIVAVARQL